MGQQLFVICINNASGQQVRYNVLVAAGKGMSDAISAVKTALSVTVDPSTVQNGLQNGVAGTPTVDLVVS